MYKYIEIWDSIIFSIYNIAYSLVFFLVDKFRFRKELEKNRELKDAYKGERCFIVLNGPSLRNYDLSKLEGEKVICSNFFFLTEYYEIVKPMFHCFIDSDWAKGSLFEKLKEQVDNSTSVKYIMNKKVYLRLNSREKSKSYFVYANNFPSVKKVRWNMKGRMSSLNNVGLFAIQVAMYMGFSDIYILGLDFAPGPLECCYNAVEEEQYGIDVYKKNNRRELCSFHWYYYYCQLCSFYLQNEAIRNQRKIVNLNKDSWIRAFEFGNYEELFD